MKVLIVEDSVLVAMGIETALEEAGHTVAGMAPCGSRAIDLAGKTRPDLCLADVHLARGSSGVQVAREIRRRFGIPTLFVTANASLIDKAGRAVAVGYLRKPFTDCDLIASIAAVARLLRGEAAGRTPAGLCLFGREP